ncbi:TM59L protein, partial [Nothoprocta ornata]|nr:TM59L protein [Nothoprocta ornata]
GRGEARRAPAPPASLGTGLAGTRAPAPCPGPLRASAGPSSSSSRRQDAVLNACYRGCRLFSICHFVDAGAGLDATRAQCEAACAEAYGGAEEQRGCASGCRQQQLPAESGPEQGREPAPGPLAVLDLLSTLCSGIVSSAQSFISSTWTFSLQADDGKVVVFQVGLRLRSIPVPEQLGRLPLLGWHRGGTRAAPGSEPPPAPGSGQRVPEAPEPGGRAEPPPPGHDLLGCMSRRSGLPRWILAAGLLLSVAAMLWLSCAGLVTAPEHRVRTQVPGARRGDK